MNALCGILMWLGDRFFDLAQISYRAADKTGRIEWTAWEPEDEA